MIRNCKKESVNLAGSINLIPMINLVFLLLIFFLLTGVIQKKDDPERIFINKERIKHWLSVGAKPTERVTKFLALEGLIKKPDIPKQTKKDKPRKGVL